MDIIERDVLLTSKEDGKPTMDFPITRLGNIEDTADVKEAPASDDYIPIMDGADDGQMKKLPWSAVEEQFAGATHTHKEISDEINTHNSSSEAHGDIREGLASKQDKLTGTQGQLVGFDKNGNAVPQAAPDTGVTTFNGRTGAVMPQSGDYTAAQVGARPITWTPTASDVGASPTGHNHSKSEITDFPTSMPASDVPAWAKASSKPSYTASEVGARPSTWTPSAADVGAVPTTRKVNNKALSADISLTASDVGASPTGHKHAKSEITDFPTSMPASDVYTWAKASTKPSYTASEVGALSISGGTLTGDLRIKGSGNYGTKINLGDGDYVHIYEPEDDKLEIKANSIKFVTSNNSDGIDIDDLKTSVSNGKSAIASAITDKGVSTSATADFSTMAANIRSISTVLSLSGKFKHRHLPNADNSPWPGAMGYTHTIWLPDDVYIYTKAPYVILFYSDIIPSYQANSSSFPNRMQCVAGLALLNFTDAGSLETYNLLYSTTSDLLFGTYNIYNVTAYSSYINITIDNTQDAVFSNNVLIADIWYMEQE